MLNTPVKDMVSTIGKEESVPSWQMHKEPFWLCGMDEREEDSKVLGLVEYISEPFPEHELEPYGWHDILATLDVCDNVHEGAIYCDEEGYDIRSAYMVSIVQESEESITESRNYDEEIILEGPRIDSSRISHSIELATSQEIPLMPMRMEITFVEDVDVDSLQGKELSEVKRGETSGSDRNEMIEGEFYDASDELPSDEENSKKKPSRKQRNDEADEKDFVEN